MNLFIMTKRNLGTKLNAVVNNQIMTPYLQGPSSNARSFSNIVRQYNKSKINVFIGGPSMQAYILNQFKINPRIAEQSVYIGARPWIANVHNDWYQQKWGQTSRYLTQEQQKIANSLFPGYPDDELMTFHMVKEIFAEQERLLKATGIECIIDHVTSIDEIEGRGLVAHINGREQLLTDTSDFNIFNAARMHIQPKKLPAKNFGEVYWKTKNNPKTTHVGIVGSGVSLNWACRDLEHDCNIVHLIPPGERARPDLKGQIAAAIRLEYATTNWNSDNTVDIEGLNILNDTPMSVRLDASRIYSAMGYRFNDSLVKVNSNKVTYIDGSPRPESIAAATRLSSGRVSQVANDLRNTSVPDGNMALNYLKIQSALGHYDPLAPNAILLFQAWKSAVSNKALQEGVTIPNEFFDNVEPLVKNIYKLSVPTKDQLYTVLEMTYNKTLNNPIKTSNSDIEEKILDSTGFKELIDSSTDDVVKETLFMGKEEDHTLGQGPDW